MALEWPLADSFIALGAQVWPASPVRSGVERGLATMKRYSGTQRVRYFGLARNLCPLNLIRAPVLAARWEESSNDRNFEKKHLDVVIDAIFRGTVIPFSGSEIRSAEKMAVTRSPA